MRDMVDLINKHRVNTEVWADEIVEFLRQGVEDEDPVMVHIDAQMREKHDVEWRKLKAAASSAKTKEATRLKSKGDIIK